MFFMYLKWPWLLPFFAKMLLKQFKFKIIELNKRILVTTETTIPRYNFMVFYVFEMAMAIAFLFENAVEAI